MSTNPESQIPNPESQVEDAGEYCRQVEQHLCRTNEGHLIRISGPRFDLVQGWFLRGIPLKIAIQGINRGVERRRAKDSRRRPVPIEFCEDDVLDVFDEWRRSVGVPEAAGEVAGAARSSLPAHLERVIARLTAVRAGGDRSLDRACDDVVRELDAARATAKSIRGEARYALIERLRQLDESLVDAARDQCDETTLRRLESEADEELKPFRARMPADAYRQSHGTCVARLVREHRGLPVIAFE